MLLELLFSQLFVEFSTTFISVHHLNLFKARSLLESDCLVESGYCWMVQWALENFLLHQMVV